MTTSKEVKNKEVLHTQGEWKTGNGGNAYATERNDGYEVPITVKESGITSVCLGFIWGADKEQAKANAELICKAVNERQQIVTEIGKLLDEKRKLLDSNRELVEAAKLVLPILDNPKDKDKYLFRVDILKEAINNAKNIQ